MDVAALMTAVLPWALCGVAGFVGLLFAILLLRASRKSRGARSEVDDLSMRLAQMTQRAQLAEARLGEAQQRAEQAESRINQAERRAADAHRLAEQARTRAETLEREAAQALEQKKRADATLAARRAAQVEQQRQADERARSLLAWARSQWEGRRESDRQRAQGQQGSFQAQLDAYLALRRAPVTFTATTPVDRLAKDLLARYATDETVDVDGDEVRIAYPVVAGLGFRA